VNPAKIIVLLAVSLFAFVPAIAGSTAAATPHPSIFHATTTAPAYVYTGENFSLYINCTYGWANYSVTVYTAGYNLTGISPTTTNHSLSPNSPYFKVNVVSPDAAQTLIIHVVATATVGGDYVVSNSTVLVNVLSPIVLHATLTNNGPVAIYNFTVMFYIDGTQVAEKTVPSLGPYGSENITMDLAYPSLSDGEHTISVKVSNSQVSATGNTAFYYGTPPNYDWIYYLAAAGIAFAILIILGGGKRKTKFSIPKWRKKKS
jgi:hypothetical protein